MKQGVFNWQKTVNYNVKCKVLKLWQTASISAYVRHKGKYIGKLRKNNLKSSAGLSHLNYICLAKNARKRFRALHNRHKVGCSTTLVSSLLYQPAVSKISAFPCVICNELSRVQGLILRQNRALLSFTTGRLWASWQGAWLVEKVWAWW